MNNMIQEKLTECLGEINSFRSRVEREIVEKILSKFKAEDVQLNHYPSQLGFTILELVEIKNGISLASFQYKIQPSQIKNHELGYSHKMDFVYKVEYNKQIFG